MVKIYKRIVSMILVMVLVFSMVEVGCAQEKQLDIESVENGLNKHEIQEIIEKIEKTESESDYRERAVSEEEMKDCIESVEGVECTELEEESVSVEDAVDEMFNSDEIVGMDSSESMITEYEDTKYITEIYEEGNVTYIKTYSEDMLQMSILSYDGETINTDNYVYNATLGEFEKQHMELVCKNTEDAKVNDVCAQAISYASKTKSAKWKDITYWYQTGNNGKKTYLKIGAKAAYRIRTDNLSSAKDKKCDAYMSAVKTSKSYEKKALAYATAAGVSGTTIIALVLANVSFPPSTIITIVFSVLGGGATVYNAINYTVDSFEKWQDAKDYYNMIKSYGTKI